MRRQAAHSRGNDVDADLCEITDLLFEEIARTGCPRSAGSTSTFATDDSSDPHADIIRIRYPLSAVWDIPIAVHEFGHFISRRIQQKRADGSTFLPFEVQKAAVLEQKQAERPDAAQPAAANAQSPAQRAIDWPIYMDELFADILATYAIGPAFAFSAVMLRFDPLTSTVHEDGKHPPYADRVRDPRDLAALEGREDDARGSDSPGGVVLEERLRGGSEGRAAVRNGSAVGLQPSLNRVRVAERSRGDLAVQRLGPGEGYRGAAAECDSTGAAGRADRGSLERRVDAPVQAGDRSEDNSPQLRRADDGQDRQVRVKRG
jgi:hypothetical protein